MSAWDYLLLNTVLLLNSNLNSPLAVVVFSEDVCERLRPDHRRQLHPAYWNWWAMVYTRWWVVVHVISFSLLFSWSFLRCALTPRSYPVLRITLWCEPTHTVVHTMCWKENGQARSLSFIWVESLCKWGKLWNIFQLTPDAQYRLLGVFNITIQELDKMYDWVEMATLHWHRPTMAGDASRIT